MRDLGCRIIGRHAFRLVAEKRLPVLKAHTRYPQPAPERVLEIMYAQVRKPRMRGFALVLPPLLRSLDSASLPRTVIHLGERAPAVGEYPHRVQTSLCLDDRFRNII